jgi:hypothetical protein
MAERMSLDPQQFSSALAPTDGSAPPKAKRPVGLLLTVGVIVVLLLVGLIVRFVGGGPETPGAPTAAESTTTVASAPTTEATTPTPTMTTAEPTPNPVWTPYAGDLPSLLVPMPAGAQVVQITLTTQGNTTEITDDMSDIVRSATMWNPDTVSSIQNRLTSDGYQRGATRAWRDGNGNLVLIDLMAFNDANGWDRFRSWAEDGLYAGGWTNRGTISDVNRGRWVELRFDQDRELRLIMGKGEFAVVIRVESPAPANLTLLTSIAIDQFNRLP